MDRPKHRLLAIAGLALVAAVAVLLLFRQATPTQSPAPIPASASVSAAQPVEPQTHASKSPIIEAVASKVTNSALIKGGLRGRVIDAATRKPVKRIEVKLTRVRGEVREEPISREFELDDGAFTWVDLEPGTFRMVVSARGYQAFSITDLELSSDTASSEIVMPLLRGFALRGRIVDSTTREGISDAHVTFRRGDDLNYSDRYTPTMSDEDGTFVLNGIPGGDTVLSINAPKHAYRELMIFVDDKTPEQEIALSAGATIAGVVMTTAGGPAKGRVHVIGPGPGHLRETSDAGEFSFDHLPAGRYRIAVNTSAGSTSQAIQLQQDEIKDGIVLVVGGGRSIRGVVRGPKPEQFQDVGIALHTESTNSFFTSTPADDGAYTINGVPPGPGMMTVHGETFRWQRKVEMPADQDLTLDITIPAEARLSGRVTKGGEPSPNTIILLKPTDAQTNILYQAQTDDDGSYRIENLGSGEYLLRAEGDISRPITVAGDSTFNIDIPSAQLSARVVEDGGAVPIVGATVHLRGISRETSRVYDDKQTDDFGRFELTGIESGDTMLIVYKPGYEMHRETISYSTPITNRTITLRKDKGVEVRIAPGSRRFPRGFTLTQHFPHSEYIVDLWMPINSERVCYIPTALAGTTFEIGRFSGKPIVFKEWDGLPFELP